MDRSGSGGLLPVVAALAALALLAPGAEARPGPADTSWVALRLGPAHQAHSDLLASPFPQRGRGIDGALAYGRGGFRVALSAGTASTSSGKRLDQRTGGIEDVWAASLDLRYLRETATLAGVDVDLGAAFSGVTSVRRHHYLGGSSEYFADLLVPLSLAARATKAVGARTTVAESLDVAVATLLFRSPFAGAKDFPSGSLSAPWETTVLRHRLALVHPLGGRVSVGISHGLGLVTSARYRDLRLVRQDVSASVSVRLGGGS